MADAVEEQVANTLDPWGYSAQVQNELMQQAIDSTPRPTRGVGNPVSSHQTFAKTLRDDELVNGSTHQVVVRCAHPGYPDQQFEYLLPTVEASNVAELVWNSTTEYSRGRIIRQYAHCVSEITNLRIAESVEDLKARQQKQEEAAKAKAVQNAKDLLRDTEVRTHTHHPCSRSPRHPPCTTLVCVETQPPALAHDPPTQHTRRPEVLRYVRTSLLFF